MKKKRRRPEQAAWKQEQQALVQQIIEKYPVPCATCGHAAIDHLAAGRDSSIEGLRDRLAGGLDGCFVLIGPDGTECAPSHKLCDPATESYCSCFAYVGRVEPAQAAEEVSAAALDTTDDDIPF